MWTSFSLQLPKGGRGPTIAEAIHLWLEAQSNSSTIQIQDNCQGPHCNSKCPDQVILGSLSSYWSSSVQCVILAITATVTGVCVAAKLMLLLHYKYMRRIQRRIVEECAVKISVEMESTVSLMSNISSSLYINFCILTLILFIHSIYKSVYSYQNWCNHHVLFEAQISLIFLTLAPGFMFCASLETLHHFYGPFVNVFLT